MRLHRCCLALALALAACRDAPRSTVLADGGGNEPVPIGPGGCFVAEYGAPTRVLAQASAPAATADSTRTPPRSTAENSFQVGTNPDPGQFPFRYRLRSVDSTRLYLQGTWIQLRGDSAEIDMRHIPGTISVGRRNALWVGRLHDARDLAPDREFRPVTLHPLSCSAALADLRGRARVTRNP